MFHFFLKKYNSVHLIQRKKYVINVNIYIEYTLKRILKVSSFTISAARVFWESIHVYKVDLAYLTLH